MKRMIFLYSLIVASVSYGAPCVDLTQALQRQHRDILENSSFDLRKKILTPDGKIRKESKGMDGYARFARDHYEGKMQNTFLNVSAVTNKSEFEELGWQAFHGPVSDFFELRGKILTSDGKIREEYKDMDGYATFAKDHYEGKMHKTFINVSAVTNKSEFEELGWQQFQGPVSDFFEIRGKILTSDGKIREEYKDMDGYATFAKDHYEGKMHKTFLNVSAVTNKSEFEELGWQQFQGPASDFFELRGKILTSDGKIREENKGMDGYARFAKDHYEGKMEKTFLNVSAVTNKSEFEELGWQQFQGPASDFFELRGKILTSDGKIREEYKDMDGYETLAKDHYEGMMEKTFVNVSAVFGGTKAMIKLEIEWKSFAGSVVQYEKLIQLFEGNDMSVFQGREGQKSIANELFKGNTIKTYINVSTLRERLLGGDRRRFSLLNWERKKF